MARSCVRLTANYNRRSPDSAWTGIRQNPNILSSESAIRTQEAVVQKLSERLTALLAEHKLSQAKVKETLSVGSSTVNEWVNGKSPIGDAYLARIVEMLPLNDEGRTRLLAELLVLSHAQRAELKVAEGEERGPWTKLLEDSRGLLLTSLGTRSSKKTVGRTLADFPGSFLPLVVIEGDKREQSESRINAADFGAVSASPAEARWLAKLQLPSNVELITDKVVVLESNERFGKTNLLVIGSPGSNHLARRLHLSPPLKGWRPAAPFFRFNLKQLVLNEVEQFIRSLTSLNPKQLVGQQGDPRTERQIKQWLSFLFTGGIHCPTGHFRTSAAYMVPGRDFGLITLARNPFSATDDYVSILASGFHMMATAHAVKMLAKPEKFANHPVGGVIRVNINQQLTFAKRFDESDADWDTGADSDYTIERLRQDLLESQTRGTDLPEGISKEEYAECLSFLDEL
jgi:predicted XRE-type DNA-binding protein